MYSLYCAREEISGPILLLESDLVYEDRALQTLLRFPSPDALLISGFTYATDEVYVSQQNGLLAGLSKQQSELNNIVGELVGISKFSLTTLGTDVSQCRRYLQG